ncbi:aminoglycoside phosphotransferase family protein [soil metagenome]
MPAEEVRIDVSLVRELVATQFPQWADLPIKPVEFGGWDNRTFRLGERLKVRLPSAERYVAQVEKESRWLPRLAPFLPLPIPAPIAVGSPGRNFPWPWSISTWLAGEPAGVARISDLSQFANDLVQFLLALQRIDPADGPSPGAHNFFRGGSLKVYDVETRRAIASLAGEIDDAKAAAVWNAALVCNWHSPPVWIHGDVAAGNLLIQNGRLSAVIDFGGLAVGDPACDLVVAWTFFDGASREAFQTALPMDSATWARARGWALWKALITLAAHPNTGSAEATTARRVIDDVLTEHDA